MKEVFLTIVVDDADNRLLDAAEFSTSAVGVNQLHFETLIFLFLLKNKNSIFLLDLSRQKNIR